jgi:hypothetical protein
MAFGATCRYSPPISSDRSFGLAWAPGMVVVLRGGHEDKPTGSSTKQKAPDSDFCLLASVETEVCSTSSVFWKKLSLLEGLGHKERLTNQ